MVAVTYCGQCDLPCEYCEYNVTPTYEKCKAWMKEHASEQYDTLVADVLVAETESLEIDDDEAKKKKRAGKGLKRPSDKGATGGKVHVVFDIKKNRKLTTVFGLDKHGLDLKAASKKLKSKFACAASVQDVPGEGPAVQVQGDVMDKIEPVIMQLVPTLKPADIKMERKK